MSRRQGDDFGMVDEWSIMVAATTSSPKTSPRRPNGLRGADQLARSSPEVELEEQVCGSGFERVVGSGDNRPTRTCRVVAARHKQGAELDLY